VTGRGCLTFVMLALFCGQVTIGARSKASHLNTPIGLSDLVPVGRSCFSRSAPAGRYVLEATMALFPTITRLRNFHENLARAHHQSNPRPRAEGECEQSARPAEDKLLGRNTCSVVGRVGALGSDCGSAARTSWMTVIVPPHFYGQWQTRSLSQPMYCRPDPISACYSFSVSRP
jgi:hypothetical protein